MWATMQKLRMNLVFEGGTGLLTMVLTKKQDQSLKTSHNFRFASALKRQFTVTHEVGVGLGSLGSRGEQFQPPQ